MSIRLRLTLLYCAVLAITLIGFSAILYLIQSQATLNSIQSDLVHQAQGLAGPERPFQERDEGFPAGGGLPGRWTQLCDPSGTVLARTPDLAGTSLPLSATGLKAVQQGRAWSETATVQSETVLVYSQPVIAAGHVTQIVQVAAPLAQQEAGLSILRWILIAGSLCAILAAFGAGWLIAGTALQPIERITHTAQAIGAEQDFSRRVQHVGPNDEVGQLASTFNTMLTELEAAYRRVEQTLQAQRRFVADASHELRTPLTTIRGNVEWLRHDPPAQVERSEALADTQAEVERLMRLVNQLLVLARADAGRQLRREEVLLAPLAEDACRQMRLRAPNRQLTCDVSLDAVALGDPDALKQVVLILLDNALVHTAESAAVSLTGGIEDGRTIVRVRDTGPGIPPEILPHIFERFYRGDIARSGPGAGLGLAIAQELAEAQQGTLDVTSEPGQGTTFTLSLPRPGSPHADAHP